jgi:hypothetical protein
MHKQYLLIIFFIPFFSNAQYNVGNDDGFATSCYNQHGGYATMFAVGSDDGFAKSCYNQNGGYATMFAVNTDDGFAKNCYNQHGGYATMFAVGSDDGFAKSCIGSFINEVPILPTELLSFTTECDGHNILLRWITLTENNNAYFTIEKGDDGLNWEIVAIINGAGNSYTPIQYQYNDEPVYNKTIYYRLGQTDLDGAFRYLNTVAVNCSQNTPISVKVYPNPFENKLNVDLIGYDKEAKVEMINALGLRIFETTFNQKLVIPTTDIADGLYLIKVMTDREVFYQKVIKNCCVSK